MEKTEALLSTVAPEGTLSVYGGSRVVPGDSAYELTREFTRLWAREMPAVPVCTGGGPGNMEAANRGAHEAGGKSIGLAMGNLPQETLNPYLTHSLVYQGFAQREAEIIDRARAHVFTRGGIGTVWEFFEVLTKFQNDKIGPKGLILLGPRSDWDPLLKFVDVLVRRGLMDPRISEKIELAETAAEAVKIAKRHVAETPYRKPSATPTAVENDINTFRRMVFLAKSRLVTVLGDSRKPTKIGNPLRDLGKQLARNQYAVATGTNPGSMDDLNRGARAGKGKRLGFFAVAMPRAEKGDRVNQFHTGASLSQAESELIDHAGAIVVGEGGEATQWGMFEVLTKLATKQITPRPLALMWEKETWEAWNSLIDLMVAQKTVSPTIKELVVWTPDAASALRAVRERFDLSACRFAQLVPRSAE